MNKILKNNYIGCTIRLNRLFGKDGFAVCVAADYGFMSVPFYNVYYLRKIVEKVIRGRVDGILLSPGQILHLSDLFSFRSAPAIMVRCDWINATRLPVLSEHILVPSSSLKRMVAIYPRDAIRLGVTAFVSYLFLGYGDSLEAENIKSLAELVNECHDVGLPFGIEPIPIGSRITGVNMSKILEYGVSLSFELGADFLKVPYTGNEESFEGVIKAAKGVPVLVLGGARSDRYQDAIDMAMDAKSAGAKGIVFGRNVTQSKDPELIISKLYDLFHGASIEKKKFLKKKVIIKSELCTNCNLCAVACSFRHTGRQGLDGSTIIINHNESKSIYPKIHICNQCGKCINVCKKEALHFLKEGGISLDPGKCNGCGECTRVCPQGVIKMDNNNHIPYVCDLCNGEPECVLACPTGALSIKEIC